MPTPILIEGWEHQEITTNDFGSHPDGLFQFAEGVGSMSWQTGRNGQCLRIAPAGVASRVIKQLQTDISVGVFSFYFKTTSAVAVTLVSAQTAAFAQTFAFELKANGKSRINGNDATETGTVNDGSWHRVDIRSDVSANPWLTDFQLDGVTFATGLTAASALSTIRYLIIGTSSAATHSTDYDDIVVSATTGDYPLGAHDVFSSVPTADGTHNAGTNVIEANGGTDIGVAAAWSLMDDWSPNNTDYVQQVASGSGNYAEVEFTDQVASKNIWGVEGIAALFSSNTNANNGITRIVDSGGTTLSDIYSGDMSESTVNVRRKIITAPAGGWDSGYAGVKGRVGFSTDVDGQPRWTALMLQYACADAVVATTILDPFGMRGMFGA